jgi:hydrogenase 3 maturation protease
VAVFLGEISPENLTGQIKEFKPTCLVILDALDMGAKPGHTRMVRPDQLSAGATASTHNVSLTVLLDYLGNFLDCEILIIGIQPQTLEFGRPLSEPVVKAAKSVAGMMALAVGVS